MMRAPGCSRWRRARERRREQTVMGSMALPEEPVQRTRNSRTCQDEGRRVGRAEPHGSHQHPEGMNVAEETGIDCCSST